MREIELRRKMRATVVPTNDGEVRRMLRQLGEPVTLFGEREVRTAVVCMGECGWSVGVGAVPCDWVHRPQQHAASTAGTRNGCLQLLAGPCTPTT